MGFEKVKEFFTPKANKTDAGGNPIEEEDPTIVSPEKADEIADIAGSVAGRTEIRDLSDEQKQNLAETPKASEAEFLARQEAKKTEDEIKEVRDNIENDETDLAA